MAMPVPLRIPAALAVVVLSITLTACASTQPSATPSPTSPTIAPPTSPPEPEAVRPVNVTGTTCDQLVPLELIEAAAGAELVPGGVLQDALADAFVRAQFEYAGGLWCTWLDAASGELRSFASMVPSGEAAEVRVSEEFAEFAGGTPITEARPLSAGCLYDYCRVDGSIDGDFVHLAVVDLPWFSGDAEIPAEVQALQDALATKLAALPPAAAIPPLTAPWSDGPHSCEELVPSEQLATELGASAVRYSPGYAYEESIGTEIALLTAGGFTCRFATDDQPSGGRVVVLPDAASAHGDAMASAGASPDPATGAVISCRPNGDTVDASITCSASVAAGGAWLAMSDTDYVEEAALIQRVSRTLATFAAALEAH